MSKPEIVRAGLCNIQCCVPKFYTDEQIEAFANSETPTGIKSQWKVRKQADYTEGGNERVQCEQDYGKVHVILDC